MLAVGVALHLAIEVTLRAGFFSWVVLATYVAFIPPARADRLVTWLSHGVRIRWVGIARP